jgi:S1-C subfamily serine protease
VAILQLEDQRGPLPHLELDARTGCYEGEDLALCGFPFGMELHGNSFVTSSFHRAMVSAVLPHTTVSVSECVGLQLDAMVNGGNSGGPLFRPSTGKAVGVVVASFSRVHLWPSGDDGEAEPERSQGEEANDKPGGIEIPSGIGFAVPAHVCGPGITRLRSGPDAN